MIRALAVLVFAAGVGSFCFVACDNGTTNAPIPVYEAGSLDVQSVFLEDAGRDSGALDGMPADGAHADGKAPDDGSHPDSNPPVDAGREPVPDAAHDSAHDAHGDSHVDASTDAAHDAGAPSDALDAAITDASGDVG